MRAQLDRLSHRSTAQAEMLDCLCVAVRHLEALERSALPTHSAAAEAEPDRLAIVRQLHDEEPSVKAQVPVVRQLHDDEPAAEAGVSHVCALSKLGAMESIAPADVVTRAQLADGLAAPVCGLHELAVAALEARGIDGLLPLAESLCTVELGRAQEAIAMRALVRAFERAVHRWQLDEEVVSRDDELWCLGRALADLPSRLQLELIRLLGTSPDALFLFQLCVASRAGWGQVQAQAAESLAAHWLALHSEWLTEEALRRDEFNEGEQLGIFEDYEFWEPSEIEAAIRRWHTLTPSSTHTQAARSELHLDPRLFEICLELVHNIAHTLATSGDEPQGPASRHASAPARGALTCLAATRALGCRAAPACALGALLGWREPDALAALPTLSLRGCRWVSSALVRRLLGACGGVQVLDLSGATGSVDDEIARLVGESLTCLRHLDLSGCTQLTDKGICALIDALPQTLALDLTADAAKADAARGAHALAWPPVTLRPRTSQSAPVQSLPLERLSVHGCHQLTDRSIARIARSAHALEELCASGAPRLTDEAILTVSTQSACPRLRWLNVCGAYKVTQSAMQCVLQSKPTLLLYNRPEDFPHRS